MLHVYTVRKKIPGQYVGQVSNLLDEAFVLHAYVYGACHLATVRS